MSTHTAAWLLPDISKTTNVWLTTYGYSKIIWGHSTTHLSWAISVSIVITQQCVCLARHIEDSERMCSPEQHWF
ncbi:hypothetical protein Ddc_11258 [Ditylenchus destructor]|nr:hypothetical protein Ddc_11258 [Ditylenchus destructor]